MPVAQRSSEKPAVAVIGAGIVGACVAVELTKQGHNVTLIDPAPPGGPQAASYGNGAFISPASILPMSYPGMWRQVPGYLLDPTGPLTLRWRDLPHLAPWLWRFLRAGATKSRYAATAAQLHAMLKDAPARHRALADQAGLGDLIRQEGLIYAFADRSAVEREALGWQLRRHHGVKLRELEAEAMAEALPDLARLYRFGLMVTEGAHCQNPGRYVAGLVDYACRRGATLLKAEVRGLKQSGGRLTGLETSLGDFVCGQAVLAAGISSARLARLAGEKIPLAAERGYHVELPGCEIGPRIPVMPQDGKMANTRTEAGLRAAGQVELTRPEAPPNWHRAEILLGHLRHSYPALQGYAGPVNPWYGHRPSTPDGLPVISAAKHISGLIYAFGHGHVGLAAAPYTASLTAALIAQTAPSDVLSPYSAQRFR